MKRVGACGFEQSPSFLGQAANLGPAREPRRDGKTPARAGQRSERPAGRGIVAQFQLNLTEQRAIAVRLRPARHECFRGDARIAESVLRKQAGRERQIRFPVASLAPGERAASRRLGEPKVARIAGLAAPLQQQPRELRKIGRALGVARGTPSVERDVAPADHTLIRRRPPGSRAAGSPRHEGQRSGGTRDDGNVARHVSAPRQGRGTSR